MILGMGDTGTLQLDSGAPTSHVNYVTYVLVGGAEKFRRRKLVRTIKTNLPDLHAGKVPMTKACPRSTGITTVKVYMRVRADHSM